MTLRRWSWLGACSTGSSHIKAGTGCQDYAFCTEAPLREQTALLAIVSDGAGSAELSAIGSRMVVRSFSKQALSFLRADAQNTEIDEQLVRGWLDGARDAIFAAAEMRQVRPREFAATLVAAIVLPERIAVCHVGDGACAVRKHGDESWEIPSWPAHGEYASSTYFVTDDPQPNLHFVSLKGEFVDVAVFSDGLERLALDFANKVAFDRFLGPMSAPLAGQQPGRNRKLSKQLRAYLNSHQITERTDDDKSFIVAKRVAQP